MRRHGQQQPRQQTRAVNGTDLCFFEWGESTPDTSTTLLLHATGFHARVWDQTVAHLDGHVLAVDLRGHGRSSKRGPFNWDAFAEDVAALVLELELTHIVGVGHSMGGHALTQAAAALPSRFERLLLVDPVIMAPEAYLAREGFQGFTRPEEHPTSKRRNRWSSVDEMVARFSGRAPFGHWRPEVLRDYCEFGLLRDPDDTGDDAPAGGEGATARPGFVLACPPWVEASIYIGSASRDIYAAIACLQLPVTVLRAPPNEQGRAGAMDFSKSPTWAGLAARFALGRDVFLPEHTHFIPMESPELVAEYIDGRS